VFSSPSFLGGKNWMPMAYSQQTGMFYIPSNDWGMDIWNEPIAYKKGAAYLGAGFTIKPIAPDHIGVLRAMDPTTGKIAWEYKNKAPLWGGVLTTAGGLVFTGTPEGYLKAFDAKTGQELWSSRPARAWSARQSPGKWTANSMWPSCPAGAARFRFGVAKSPRRSRKSARAVRSGCSSCPSNDRGSRRSCPMGQTGRNLDCRGKSPFTR
jgi:hypothetical protein